MDVYVPGGQWNESGEEGTAYLSPLVSTIPRRVVGVGPRRQAQTRTFLSATVQQPPGSQLRQRLPTGGKSHLRGSPGSLSGFLVPLQGQ